MTVAKSRNSFVYYEEMICAHLSQGKFTFLRIPVNGNHATFNTLPHVERLEPFL